MLGLIGQLLNTEYYSVLGHDAVCLHRKAITFLRCIKTLSNKYTFRRPHFFCTLRRYVISFFFILEYQTDTVSIFNLSLTYQYA